MISYEAATSPNVLSSHCPALPGLRGLMLLCPVHFILLQLPQALFPF